MSDRNGELAQLEAEVRRTRRRQRLLLYVSAAVLLAMAAAAVFAPLVSPHDPLRQNIFLRLRPPFWMEGGSAEHLLGTDALGRDLLSRILYGARTSLTVGVLSVLLGGAVGVLLGLLAGYKQGAVDLLLGRLADIQQTLPFIVLILALVAVLGPSKANLILVVGLGSWVYYYRIVRGEVAAVRERPYIEAARALGGSTWHVLLRHVLPNVLPSVIVTMTLYVPQVILYEAALSFLGLGVPPPEPTWGGIIAEGRDYVEIAWWITVFPGLALVITVLCLNTLGESLRDFLDPLQSYAAPASLFRPRAAAARRRRPE
ncbi:MAG: ABC transporter permease [Limnochordales bacterium]|nr:peptide ABC transporter permease [Bacillota bacterium]